MNPRRSPAIATWMLKHLAPGRNNEALTGDLLEEFRRGRPIQWYWRQVIAAIVLGCTRELRRQWPVVVFAALWAFAASAFWFYVTIRIGQTSTFTSTVWRLDWPYSSLCFLAWVVGSQVLFVWSGLLLYALLHLWMIRSVNLRRLTRLLLVSLLAFTAFGPVTALLSAGHPIHPIDVRLITGVGFAIDPRFVISRLPFFLSLLVSIWVALPRIDHRARRKAA